MAAVVFGLSLVSLLARDTLWLLIVQIGDKIYDVEIAEAIRDGRPITELSARFLGFPLTIAALSRLAVDPWLAVAIISWVSAVVALSCVVSLYGPLVAATLLAISWDWTQLSIIGNTEPLFGALVFAGFLAIRRGRSWVGATFLGFSATVRPVGVFALIGYGMVLIQRREWRTAMGVTIIALLIGVLYLETTSIIASDPFDAFRGYRSNWEGASLPIGVPFLSLLVGMHEHLGDFNMLARARFLVTIVFGIAMALLAALRVREESLPLHERLYLVLYVAFYLCYPTAHVFVRWSRYVMPVTPLLIAVCRPWLPDDRRLWWPLVALNGVAIALNWRSFIAAVERVGRLA